MTKEQDKLLCQKYPQIFAQRHEDMTNTAMCWGFDCGPGWFDIIDNLCKEIMGVCGERVPQATQVKEKFGSLRFYIDTANKEVHNAIFKAEKKSRKICEECGKRGKILEKTHWFKTLCEKDAKRLGYAEVM